MTALHHPITVETLAHTTRGLSITDRFWRRAIQGPECWLWSGSHGRRGYAVLQSTTRKKNRTFRASRLSWVIHFGEIPDGLWVLHRCDNPGCVNPAHLFLGDRRDNMVDAAAKGRICTIGRSRRTHCSRGHAYTSDTPVTTKGHRRCPACDNTLRNERRRLFGRRDGKWKKTAASRALAVDTSRRYRARERAREAGA